MIPALAKLVESETAPIELKQRQLGHSRNTGRGCVAGVGSPERGGIVLVGVDRRLSLRSLRARRARGAADIFYPGIIFDFLKVRKRWESGDSRAVLRVV